MPMHDSPAWHAYRALFEHPVIFTHLVTGYARDLVCDDGTDLRERLDWQRLRPVAAQDMPGPACPHSAFWSVGLRGNGPDATVLFLVEIHTEIDTGASDRLAACHAALSDAGGPVPRLVQLVLYDGNRPWPPAPAQHGAPEQRVLDIRALDTADIDPDSVISHIIAVQTSVQPDRIGLNLPTGCVSRLPEPEHARAVEAILEWGNLLGREHGFEFNMSRSLGEADPTLEDIRRADELRQPYHQPGRERGQRRGYAKALMEEAAAERVMLWRMAQVKFGVEQVAGMPRLFDTHYPVEDQDMVGMVGEFIMTSTSAKQLAKRMRRKR